MSDVGLGLALSLACLVVLGKDLSVGGLRYGDSAAHAMDGVLILDWLKAGPRAWGDPMGFAEAQYGHYPTLGIGTHYPPGFAVVEAAFFGVMGISATVARLAVLGFGWLSALGIYVLLRRFADRTAAALAAIAWLTFPATVEWGRQTMLEVPTACALTWSAITMALYIDRPSGGRLACLALVLGASVLFKQTAVFVFAAAALTFVWAAWRGRIPRGHALGMVLFAAVMTILVRLSLDGHGSRLLSGDATYADRWSWVVLTGYLQIIPSQIGWVVLAFTVPGMVIAYRLLGTMGVFLVAWILACYFMLTIADFKYNRYVYVGLMPFAVWSALGLGAVLRLVPAAGIRSGVAIMVSLTACGFAWARPAPLRPDYGPVVAAHRTDIENRAVLFSGLREGDFVFSVRQHLPWRTAMVLRGSKLLYACNGRPDLDFQSSVHSPTDVGRLLEQFAIERIFVERENRTGVVQEDYLRQFLAAGDAYRLVVSHALPAGPEPSKRDTIVDVYHSLRPLEPPRNGLEIPIPRAGRSIAVDGFPRR